MSDQGQERVYVEVDKNYSVLVTAHINRVTTNAVISSTVQPSVFGTGEENTFSGSRDLKLSELVCVYVCM